VTEPGGSRRPATVQGRSARPSDGRRAGPPGIASDVPPRSAIAMLPVPHHNAKRPPTS